MQIVCNCNLHLKNKQKKKERKRKEKCERKMWTKEWAKGAGIDSMNWERDIGPYIAFKYNSGSENIAKNSIQSLHHFNFNSIALESIPSVCCRHWRRRRRLTFYVAHIHTHTSIFDAHTFSIVIYICSLAFFRTFNANVGTVSEKWEPHFSIAIYTYYIVEVDDRQKDGIAQDCVIVWRV